MSLFPDRSLVPTSNREIALISPGLTDLQKKQLTQISAEYLRIHNLIGFENTKATLPVIKKIILDGLSTDEQKLEISLTDNLTVGFKKGFSKRESLKTKAHDEITNLNSSLAFQGHLALPQSLISQTREELKKSVLEPNLEKTAELVSLVEQRKPIFENLVNFCRENIEEKIPGSKNTNLSVNQEAGLLRQLLFAWAAYGETRLLLETEEFILSKDIFFKEISLDNKGELWSDLASVTNNDSLEAINYLKDLSTQVSEMLLNLPGMPKEGSTPLEIASNLNKAFNLLKEDFLVNKLTRFPTLSKDPLDVGRSIWDEDKSMKIMVNGTLYRMPTIATINLASALISAVDEEKSRSYLTGAAVVNNLITDVSRVTNDQVVPNLKKEIAQDQSNLNRIKSTLNSGDIPDELSLSLKKVQQIAENQILVMNDELEFIPKLKNFHQIYIKRAVDVLKRYQNGEIPTGEKDILEVLTIHYIPGLLRDQARYYYRERIKNRVEYLESMLATQGFANSMSFLVYPDYNKLYFHQSLDVTSLDGYHSRSKLWIDKYLKPYPLVDEADKKNVWKSILFLEKSSIHFEIAREASANFTITNHYLVDRKIEKIKDSEYHSLAKKLRNILKKEDSFDQGILPDDPALYAKYLGVWRKEASHRIDLVINLWEEDKNLSFDLNQTLGNEDLSKRFKLGEPNTIRNMLKEEFGAAKIATNALARLAPMELWPKYYVSIEDMVEDTYPRDLNDPMNFIKPGAYEEKKNRIIVYKNFKQWLSQQGIDFDDNTYKNLAKPGHMPDLVTSSHYFYRIFSVEGEIKEWFTNQQNKLDTQTQSTYPRIFSIPPIKYLKQEEEKLDLKQKRLLKKQNQFFSMLNSRVNQVAHYGLIKPESEFMF